jgi:hypothetical protein
MSQTNDACLVEMWNIKAHAHESNESQSKICVFYNLADIDAKVSPHSTQMQAGKSGKRGKLRQSQTKGLCMH